MQRWYLIRGGYQYGPYSAQDLLGMLGASGLYPQDEFLEIKSGRRFPIDKAVKKWQKAAGFRPKKRRTGLIVFACIILLIGGFIGYKFLTKTSDHLSLGASTAVASENIPPDGGTLTVEDGSLHGFAISVPEGAYTGSTHFSVSTRPIDGHKFGSLFTPVTPLITIDNGGVFAAESVTVTIPIEKSDDEFAMGFYYDKKSGKLEGIPIVSEDNSQITLLTNHFCDVVVSKVPTAELAGLSVDTGFMPGADDWQFTNYGSYIASGGHCAGQSVSAMWYFEEMYEGRHYPRLYGQFDNYNYGFTTNDFWRDDSDAYRFASMIQKDIDWNARAYKTQKKLANGSGSMTMNAFIYAMKMTDEPQFVEIWGKATNPDGTTSDAGHAIIAYKVEDGCIYVADPNYPGGSDRYIQFDGAGFQPYSSGSNAAAIESGYDIAFTDIYYIAQSSLIDYALIGNEYEKMVKGTIGDDKFPTYKMELLKSIDENGNQEWIDCPDTLKVDSAENVKNLGDYFRDKIRICVTAQYKGLTVSLYSGLNDAQVLQTLITDGNGQAVFDVDLKEGINDIGFYISYPQGNDENYIDMARVKVEYDLTADMKFEKDSYDVICQNEASFAVTVKNAPGDMTYVWDFGDGSTLETEEPQVDYTYNTGGEYVITCSMEKNSDGKVLAEARSKVSAIDLFGTWNFNYTITEAGAVNSIANFFGDMILKFIQQIFPDQGVPDTANINIEGTVVTCTMSVSPSAGGPDDGKYDVELQQLTSSTDFIDVDTTPIPGYVTVDKDKVTIVLTGNSEDSGSTGALKFEGTLSNGILSGTFTASGIMSGDFEAKK